MYARSVNRHVYDERDCRGLVVIVGHVVGKRRRGAFFDFLFFLFKSVKSFGGPYSSGLVPDPIRIATIAPARQGNRLYGFMKELASQYRPTERKDYLPPWPGFRKAFNLDMRGAVKDCHIELDDRLEGEMKDLAAPHVVLADRLLRAIDRWRPAATRSTLSSSTFRKAGRPGSRERTATTSIFMTT